MSINTNNLINTLFGSLINNQSTQTQATQAPTNLFGTNSNILSTLFNIGGIPAQAPTNSSALQAYAQPQQQSGISQLIFVLLILQLMGGRNGQGGDILESLRRLLGLQPPQPQLFEGGGKVAKADIDALIDKYKTGTNTGVTEAEIDKAITENGANTAAGVAARTLKAVFALFAIQEGNINQISKEDASRFLKLNGQNSVLSSTEQVGERMTPAEAKKIRDYITKNSATLNEFGDKKTTTYPAARTPSLVTLSNGEKAVYIGSNGNHGLFLSLESYFAYRNPDWRNLTK